MFHTAKPKHAEFSASLKNFRDSSTNWFDGTVLQSISVCVPLRQTARSRQCRRRSASDR